MSFESSEIATSTLIARIRASDAEAWTRFVDIYTPLVYGWARRAGLDDSDAALRVRAVRSLERITGESFGDDVVAWQDYLDGRTPQQQSESVAGWLRRLF